MADVRVGGSGVFPAAPPQFAPDLSVDDPATQTVHGA